MFASIFLTLHTCITCTQMSCILRYLHNWYHNYVKCYLIGKYVCLTHIHGVITWKQKPWAESIFVIVRRHQSGSKTASSLRMYSTLSTFIIYPVHAFFSIQSRYIIWEYLVSFVKYKLCIIYRLNWITYGSIILNGVFYVIRYSTLSRGSNTL